MKERLTNQTLELSLASESDIDEVWSIIKTCSDWLLKSGHKHWDDYYSRGLFEKKIQTESVYLASVKGTSIATITTSTEPVEYYEENDMQQFKEPDTNALYVTALAVLPQYQQQGYATKLMDFAEDQANESNLDYVRFDCKALYVELVNFYRDRGYNVVGVTIDEEDNDEPYFLMEKKVSKLIKGSNKVH
ncbi:GNAT family N-acetyltransferase [Patescibacteria group bacterium]